MQLDQLLDMDDEDFERVVMQAVKRREDFPEWWRAVAEITLARIVGVTT